MLAFMNFIYFKHITLLGFVDAFVAVLSSFGKRVNQSQRKNEMRESGTL